jgi:hypothetical protein
LGKSGQNWSKVWSTSYFYSFLNLQGVAKKSEPIIEGENESSGYVNKSHHPFSFL